MKTGTKLWIGLGILVLLSPLGILLPEYFKAGSTWGEWDNAGIKDLAGYLPEGLKRLSGIWKAPIPDYGQEQGISFIRYAASALFGILLAASLSLLIAKFLKQKK